MLHKINVQLLNKKFKFTIFQMALIILKRHVSVMIG